MNEVNADRSRLVAALSNRLRMAQAGFADEAPEVRRQYLSEELKQTLAKVVPGERAAFLQELRDNFPTWDTQVGLESDAAAPAAGAMDLAELRDPSFLATRLIEAAEGLNVDQRAVLAQRLAMAGLAPAASSGAWSAETEAAFKTKQQVPADKSIDANRALDLATMLAEFASSLQQVAWTTWRAIAPKSQVRQPGKLQTTIGRFAANDQDVPRGQVSQDLDKLRQMIASIIASVSQAGKQFARAHVEKCSPQAVRSAIEFQGVGFMKNKDAACWQKYVELAGSMDENSIDAQIMQSIGGYAESLMKGLGK